MPLMCETHPKNKAVAVCHHCGKPLCSLVKLPAPYVTANERKSLCGYKFDDPLLSNKKLNYAVEAMHCSSCIKSFHPEFLKLMQNVEAKK
jgi:hypothetical protein